MPDSPAEHAMIARFEGAYDIGRAAVMQRIVDDVCGCGHVGTSWTTRSEAEGILDLLHLSPHSRLLDLGAGAGWPGLYLIGQSGCTGTLVDLPETGLAIARQRAADDGIANRVTALRADAAHLPLSDACFDAINQSDLLCCLQAKEAVLAECRRVIAADGRMALSVLTVAPGLSPSERTRAISASPDFVETRRSYPDMLAATGWTVLQQHDLTADYEACTLRQIDADRRHEAALRDLIGNAEFEDRAASWRTRLAAIRDRITLRELYLAEPATRRGNPNNTG